MASLKDFSTWKFSEQIIDKSFSYHPVSSLTIWITGMYFFIVLPRPGPDEETEFSESDFGLGSLFSVLVDWFSGQHTQSPRRQSPWVEEGGYAASWSRNMNISC